MKKYIPWIILAALVVGCFLLRVLPQWGIIFTPEGVMFKGVDSWYHMRLADVCYSNFPLLLEFDKFATLGGVEVQTAPLMTFLIALLGKAFTLLGIQAPVDTAGAFIPPIVGALTVIPLFLIGRKLAGVTGAVIASLLLIILPSALLYRTLLGFTDHHCLEALFTTCILLSLTLDKTKYNAVFGGLALTLLLFSWHGGAFIVVILAIGVLILLLTRYWKKELELQETKYYSSLFAFPIIPLLLYKLQLSTTLISLLFFVVPIAIYYLRNIGRVRMVCLLIAAGIIGLCGITWYLGGVKPLLDLPLSIFGGINTTIEEAMPTTTQEYFYGYGIGILVSLLGAYYLARRGVKDFPLLIFFLIILAATVFQRRWNYYLIIPVSLLASLATVEVIKSKKKAVRGALIVITCLFLVIPTIRGTIEISTYPNRITKEWVESLVWLKENSEDPFNTPNAYFTRELKEDPKYTILSWWDYGHWIIRISERVPLTSPSYQVMKDSEDFKFLTSQTIEESYKHLENLEVRYIVLNREVVSSKFPAVVLRWRQATVEEAYQLLPNSTAMKLWENNFPRFTLVFARGDIRIYERDDLHAQTPKVSTSQ